jgi:hypothetical protein
VGHIVVWALLTGGVTGSVWTGIVLWRHRQRVADRHLALSGEVEDRLDDLADTKQRLLEAEERLDYAERMLLRQREAELRRPPDSARGDE